MTKRMGAAIVALVAMSMVAGCAPAGPEPDPDATQADQAPEESAVYDGDPLPDISLSEVALAASPTADPEARTGVIGLTDSRLLTTKPGAERVIQLDAHDIETGELAWDITLWESRQIAIDGGLDAGVGAGRLELSDATVQRTGGDTVFAPVFGNLCSDEECSNRDDIEHYDDGYRAGIVALAAADGSVLWVTDLTDHLGDDVDHIGLHPIVVDATAETTLVNVEGETGDGSAAAVALDTATGEVRWAQRDTYVAGVAGGTVTGVRPDDPSEARGDLVGLDAATGEELWAVDDGASGAWLPGGPQGNLAAVALPESDIVDLRTGELVRMGRFPVDPVLGFADSAFVAWLDSSDGAVLSYADGDDRATTGEEPLAGDAVRAVSGDDYLWVATGGEEDPQVFAADRTGAVRSDPIVGELVDVRAHSVATVTPDGAVHLWRYAAG